MQAFLQRYNLKYWNEHADKKSAPPRYGSDKVEHISLLSFNEGFWSTFYILIVKNSIMLTSCVNYQNLLMVFWENPQNCRKQITDWFLTQQSTIFKKMCKKISKNKITFPFEQILKQTYYNEYSLLLLMVRFTEEKFGRII